MATKSFNRPNEIATLQAGTTWNFYSCYGYFADNACTEIVLVLPVTAQRNTTTSLTLTRCLGSLRSSEGVVGGYSFDFLPYVTQCDLYSAGRGIVINIQKTDGFGITSVTTICGYLSVAFQENV